VATNLDGPVALNIPLFNFIVNGCQHTNKSQNVKRPSHGSNGSMVHRFPYTRHMRKPRQNGFTPHFNKNANGKPRDEYQKKLLKIPRWRPLFKDITPKNLSSRTVHKLAKFGHKPDLHVMRELFSRAAGKTRI
jgi:hypothetical protein